MTDIRARYWMEAHKNIEESHKHDTATQGYWLNLAVAGVNALMAMLPDSALDDVMVELARWEQMQNLNQKAVQRKIAKDLKPDNFQYPDDHLRGDPQQDHTPREPRR